MNWLLVGISANLGFKIAVGVLVLVKWAETRNRLLYWWAIGWLVYACHPATQLLGLSGAGPVASSLGYLFYALPGVFFLRGVTYQADNTPELRQDLFHLALVIAATINAILGFRVYGGEFLPQFISSNISGISFVIAGIWYYRKARPLAGYEVLLVWAMVLTGLHQLDYPFLRPVSWFAPIGFTLTAIFSLLFAIGVVLWSSRELVRQRDESKLATKCSLLLGAIARAAATGGGLEEKLAAVERAWLGSDLESGIIIYVGTPGGKSSSCVASVRLAEADKIASIVMSQNRVDIVQLPDSSGDKTQYDFVVAAPLYSDHSVCGAILIPYNKRETKIFEDGHFLSSLGYEIGAIVSDARLWEEQRYLHDELEAKVANRTKELEDTRRATLNMLEDLDSSYRDLNSAKDKLEIWSKDLENLVQKRTHELSQSHKYLEVLISNLADGLIVLDSDGMIMDLNPAMCVLLDQKRSKIIGRDIYDYAPETERQLWKDILAHSRNSKQQREWDTTIINAQGGKIPVAIKTQWIAELDGGRFLIVLRDARMRQELEQMRRDFVTAVSHEFRTPLTAIQGYISLLLDGRLGEIKHEQKTRIERISYQANRLRELIERLLQLKSFQQVLSGGPATVVMGTLVDKIIANLRPIAELKKVELTSEVAANIPRVSGDAGALELALTSLVDNAIKFVGKGGKVSISVSYLDKQVTIKVRDDGPGIATEETEHIFDEFYRGKKTGDVPGQKGLGLGLAIAKRIIEYHGGSIDLETAAGKGSEFIIRLPMREDYEKENTGS